MVKENQNNARIGCSDEAMRELDALAAGGQKDLPPAKDTRCFYRDGVIYCSKNVYAELQAARLEDSRRWVTETLAAKVFAGVRVYEKTSKELDEIEQEYLRESGQ